MKEKIALLGGTGRLGKGLALRLMKEHDVIIGSRAKERAELAVKEVISRAERLYSGQRYNGSVEPATNQNALKQSNFIIISIKAEQIEEFLTNAIGYNWSGKIVISPVTRMKNVNGLFEYHPFESYGRKISAAEYIKENLKNAEVLSALHLLPASLLWREKEFSGYDVPVAGDESAARKAIEVLSCIGDIRFLYAGHLQSSYLIESVLPLLLNIASRNGFKNPGLRVLP